MYIVKDIKEPKSDLSKKNKSTINELIIDKTTLKVLIILLVNLWRTTMLFVYVIQQFMVNINTIF